MTRSALEARLGLASTVAIAAAATALCAALGCASPSVVAPRVWADAPRFEQAPHYAGSPWASLHRDSRNSDYVPAIASPDLRVAWTALDGAALFVGPTLGPEGNVYVPSGRGAGTSHLHAFDRYGRLLWESAPQRSTADLDYGAVINAPVVDAEGRVYIGDLNQLWAFSADGEVLWQASLRAHGARGHFVTPILTREGYIGGFTTDGKGLFFKRGRAKQGGGTLAWPVFELPGVGGPPAQPFPPGMLGGGLLVPKFVQPIWDLILGLEIEVANTPAVDPVSGRIYLTAGGASPQQGVLYGIDTSPAGLQIAFTAPMGPGSGTSPAISPDGRLVYGAGADTVMIAFDAESGAQRWRAEGIQAAASPAIGPDGTVYSFWLDRVVALDGKTGALRWRAELDALARERLPARRNLLRTARVDSVLTVTEGAEAPLIYAAVDLMYEIGGEGAVDIQGAAVPVPQSVLLVTIDTRDGRVAGVTPIRDSSGAIVAASNDGRVYVSLTGTTTSMFYYGLNEKVPEAIRTKGPPLAGLVALEPVSYERYVRTALAWVYTRCEDARAAGGRDARAAAIDRARAQLQGIPEALAAAERRGEVPPMRVREIEVGLERATEQLARARSGDSAALEGAIVSLLGARTAIGEVAPH